MSRRTYNFQKMGYIGREECIRFFLDIVPSFYSMHCRGLTKKFETLFGGVGGELEEYASEISNQ